MKRSLLGTALLLGLAMSLGPGAPTPAAAGDWYIGGGFRVGGLEFSLAFDHARDHLGPYYYRTRHSPSHAGYGCGSYCLKRSGYIYHHSGCPLVLHHFRVHRFHPARAWDYYRGPGYDRYPGRGRDYGHRDYGYRGRGHRDYGQRGRGHRDYGYRGRGQRDYGRDEHRYRGDYPPRHRHHEPRYCPYR